MEKLIQKFKEIYETSINNEDTDRRYYTNCAEFTKQVAIKFSKYEGLYYSDIHNPVINSEELFNKFIEEEYGK